MKLRLTVALFLLSVTFQIGFVSSSESAAVFSESFESSSPGSIPSGWTRVHSGQSIGVSGSVAYDGSKSVLLRGQPYGGADITTGIPALTSGKYEASYYMKVDTTLWTGNDGDAKVGYHFPSGAYAYIGICKLNGAYKIGIYDGTNYPLYVDTAVSVGQWNKYSIIVDFDANTTAYYVNGTNVGNGQPGISTATNIIDINSGNAGPGNGHPAAYYDMFLIESVPSCPGAFTQADVDAAYQAGKNYCIQNPSACGILTGGNGTGQCATYDFFSSTVHIPCFDTGSRNYSVDLGIYTSTPELLLNIRGAQEIQ